VVEKVIILYDSDPMIALVSVPVFEDGHVLEPFDGESPFFPDAVSVWRGGMLHILDQAMYRVHPIFWVLIVSVSGSGNEVDGADVNVIVIVSGGMRLMIRGIMSGSRRWKTMEKVIGEEGISSDFDSDFDSDSDYD
jgi:hypothetical protein